MGIQLHHCPVVNNITKKAKKRQGTKPCPPHFLPHYLTNEYLFFSITSLQGGLHNWGYLHPQNEWESSYTIALSSTTLPKRREKDKVQNHALHIFYPIFSLTNFYFFNFIGAGRFAQLGISPPSE